MAGIREEVVIFPTSRSITIYLDTIGLMREYIEETLSVALGAAIAADPMGYITDVYAQREMSFEELECAVDSAFELSDIIYHDYAHFIEPLRDRENLIYSVRDLSFTPRHWSFVLQSIPTGEIR